MQNGDHRVVPALPPSSVTAAHQHLGSRALLASFSKGRNWSSEFYNWSWAYSCEVLSVSMGLGSRNHMDILEALMDGGAYPGDTSHRPGWHPVEVLPSQEAPGGLLLFLTQKPGHRLEVGASAQLYTLSGRGKAAWAGHVELGCLDPGLCTSPSELVH